MVIVQLINHRQAETLILNNIMIVHKRLMVVVVNCSLCRKHGTWYALSYCALYEFDEVGS